MQSLLESRNVTVNPQPDASRHNDNRDSSADDCIEVLHQVGPLYEGSTSFTAEISQATEITQRATNSSDPPSFVSSPDLRLGLDDYHFSRRDGSKLATDHSALPMHLISTVLAKIKRKSWILEMTIPNPQGLWCT